MREMSKLSAWCRFVANALALPALIFGLARAAVMATAHEAGAERSITDALVRFDAFLYLRIAQEGYSLGPCTGGGYRPDQWCGTAGWFPSYPLLTAAVSRLGLSYEQAAVWLAGLAHLATLVLLWNTFLKRKWTTRSVLALLFVAFGTGVIYEHAAFPISLALLFSCACLYALSNEMLAWAAITGFVAATLYSTMFLLAPVVTIWSLAAHSERRLRERLRLLLPVAAIVAGYVTVMVVLRLSTGVWGAFFLVQAKYGHHLVNPLATLKELLLPVLSLRLTEKASPAFQTLLALLLVFFTVVAAWRTRDQQPKAASLLALCVIAFWLFPLSMGTGVTFPRAEALLMPAALLVVELPFVLSVLLLVSLVIVEHSIALAFFHKLIV